MNIKVVVFALVMTASMGVQGAWLTGGQLLEDCESENYFEKGSCMGYIEGVGDSVATLANWEDFAEYICTPQGVTSGQLMLVVVKNLNENPEELHMTASSLVLKALSEAFPCE